MAIARSQYSSVNSIDTGRGFELVFLRNVCYDAESLRLILFSDIQDNSKFSSFMESGFVFIASVRASSS